jgi:hypothetical protein
MLIARSAIVLAASLLAACASTPQQRFSESVNAARQDGQPLLVYMLYTTDSYAGDNTRPTILPMIRIGFINTGDQPIDKVDFDFEAYRNSRPVWDDQGKPFFNSVTATGPIAPGADVDMQTPNAVFVTDRLIACAKLTGIQIDFHDGTSTTVPASDVVKYQTRQLRVDCGL